MPMNGPIRAPSEHDVDLAAGVPTPHFSSIEAMVPPEPEGAPLDLRSASTPTIGEPLYPADVVPNTIEAIRDAVTVGLKAIYDPEIPINIWELGLIYDIAVSDDRVVSIKMTLTSPMCPTAQSLVGQVELAAREAPHVKDADVELVWEPPWSMDSMSEEGRLLLGF
jgi:FeS assembly SUF system protein